MAMGDRIKEKRIEKGLTMEQLADRLGVGRSAVNKWEKGYVKNIKRSTIEKMCLILDCSPAYLFEWSEDIKDYGGMNDEIAFLRNIMPAEDILTDTEKELVRLFRTLPDAKRSEVIQYCKFLASEAKREKKKDTASSKEA